MNRITKIRISILAFLSVAVMLVLAKSILSPPGKTSQLAPFNFPETVPLSTWQPIDSKNIPGESGKKYDIYLGGMHYRYVQNGLPIDIEMRYLANTDGHVKGYLKKYTTIPSSPDKFKPIFRQKEGIGIYNLFVFEERAYLSACINPRGDTTVTGDQFRKNRAIYDMRFERIILWLFGQKELRDNRCLWALLSTPLQDSSPEKAYQILEQAWFSWYQWWQPQFPKD